MVTDEPSDPDEGGRFSIDVNVARLARVENFLVGGEAHFAVDRAAAEAIGEASPGGVDTLRDLIEAVKAFVARAVHLLTAEMGVRQFLDIGMSTPTTGMVHHVAWKTTPDARIVYASYDPTTLAHVHTLAGDEPALAGAVAHVHSTFDNPKGLLGAAAATLDFQGPVAVILPTTLNLIADHDLARSIVDELRDAMAAGSYLVFAHTSLDLAIDGADKAVARFNEILDETYVVRTKAQITQLIDRFDLIEPGLVPIEHWPNNSHPHTQQTRQPIPIYGAVDQKP